MPNPEIVYFPSFGGTGLLCRPFISVIPASHRTRVLTYPCDIAMPYHNRVISRRCSEDIRRVRPDTSLKTLPAHHMLLQLAPQTAWREIEAFLTAHGV